MTDVERVLADVLLKHLPMSDYCLCGWAPIGEYADGPRQYRAHIAAEQAKALDRLFRIEYEPYDLPEIDHSA